MPEIIYDNGIHQGKSGKSETSGNLPMGEATNFSSLMSHNCFFANPLSPPSQETLVKVKWTQTKEISGRHIGRGELDDFCKARVIGGYGT